MREEKKRVCVCVCVCICAYVSPSRRANRSISAFFPTSFFSSSSSSSFPSVSFSFLFLLLANFNYGWKNFFATRRCRWGLAWGLALKNEPQASAAKNHHTGIKFYYRSIKSALTRGQRRKRQQSLTLHSLSPSPVFHEFYNSIHLVERDFLFFFFFYKYILMKILIQLTQKRGYVGSLSNG